MRVFPFSERNAEVAGATEGQRARIGATPHATVEAPIASARALDRRGAASPWVEIGGGAGNADSPALLLRAHYRSPA